MDVYEHNRLALARGHNNATVNTEFVGLISNMNISKLVS